MKREQIDDIIQVLVTAYINCVENSELDKADKILNKLEYWHKRLEDGGYF